jgi:antitoxin FitA
MGTLHVRNIPPALHRRIQKLAAAEDVSLGAEVVTLLDLAVHDRELRGRQKRLLADIRRRRFHAPAGAPASLALLNEDRAR